MGISSRLFNVRRLVAGLAVAALAVTGQNLIAISASATEADSANSAVDYAGVFDGTNANLVYSASADPIPATAASTVEAWIYPTAATNDNHDRLVLSQGTNATGNFYIKRKNGVLSVYRANGADLNCGPVPSNAWTHVAFTMSGTTVNCYINGGWAYSGALANSTVGAGFAVGTWTQNLTDTNTYWQGQVDQIKVWNGVLSEAQVAQSMHAYAATGVTSAPSLLAHYDFNEGSNTDAKVYNRAGTGLDLDASVLNYSDVKTVVTGGNIDSYRTQVYKFPRTYLTAQGGWTVPSNFNSIEALTVGGGGGGGENVGNGGSGGSVAYHAGFDLTSGSVLSVKVGQGGRAGVYVDDSMVGTTATTWQTNLAGTVNTTIASAYRDGGDGQSSSLSVGATTLTAPGGRGGATYWDSNECSAGTAVHTAANTPSGAVGSGGTTNAAGAAGAQGINGNTAGTAGIASTNTFTIAGAAYKFGAGGAGAAGTTPTTAGAGGADGGGASAASTNLSVSAPRGGDGAVNSGSGGAGGITACTPGGFGGSGVVYIRTTGPKVTAITGGASSAQSIIGSVSGPGGNFSLTVSSNVGTLNIASTALAASGASKIAGSGTDKFITYQGTIAQLNAALNATKVTLQGTPVLGAVNLELNPIVSPSGNIYYNSTNGHYYQLVTTTASWASAKSAAESAGNALYGLTGYLTNVTSASEKDFIFNNISTGTLWSGGYYNGTNWVWEGGPEAGTAFWTGIGTGTAIAGQYNNFNSGEPNAGQDRVVVNWNGNGTWDNQLNTVTNPYLIEYGGRSTDPGYATAIVTVTNATVNVAFTELNFDYTTGRYANLKKLNVDGTDTTLAGTTVSTTDSTGKNIGDRVLFRGVTVRDGKTVDAVVTTRRIKDATVKNYEASTGAGGDNSNFQVDIDLGAANGFAEFQFEFYETDANIVANCNASLTCAGSNRVILQNVNISLIDIDYNQWNEISGMDSYTIANPTNIKECLTSTLTPTTTCTARGTITTFPADVRFQGRSGYDTNLPTDMAIANYGSLNDFRIKFGRSQSGSPNYYGIAFKALPWGSSVPQTFGPPATNYNIVYNANGASTGTAPATHTGPIGTGYTVATNSGSLVKTGYTFGGWNTAADGSGTAYATASSVYMPINGMTLYAVWVPSQFTLTYDANGGSSAPSAVLNNAGTAFTLSSSQPTRSGYTFGGWNTLANGTGTNFAAGANYTMPGSNTTLYAKWTAATATIAYDGNGSSSGTAPVSVTGTASASTTVSATAGTLVKTGYTFAGWNTAANGTGTDYAAGAAINYPASGTTTLYAKWTANSYTLAYNSNGGSSAPASSSVQYGATVTVAAAGSNPTRAGYTFAGWNTAANGSGTAQAAASTFAMPAANVTLYAQWTAINYNVTYNGNAPASTTVTGSQTDATNYTVGSTVTVAGVGTLAVTNYRFVGWNTLADGTGTDYATAATFNMPVGGVTLYAKWVLSTVKLTYDANGGAAGPAQDTHSAGSTIQLSAVVPVRPGYNFGGWNTAANGGGTNYSSGANYTIPGSDTVLYAKWTAINYSLTYDANGGSGAPAAVINQIVNAIVTLSNTIPTWIGYTFLGWNTAANGSGTDYSAGGSFTMGAGNTTLYAKWQGNPFTLYYSGNGGTTISPNSEGRTAGATAAVSSSLPTRSGYSFLGWNTSANGTGTSYTAGANLTMPGSNLTLYAQWIPNNSAVTYDANGGTNAPTGLSVSTGQTVTVSSGIPTRTGYAFLGWNSAANGSGTPYAAGDTLTMGNSAITFYAQWSTSSFTLSYDANGGVSAPGNQNIAYAATASVSASLPTRTGYDFLGWNTEQTGLGTTRQSSSTFTMPATNVTLYAQWALSTYTVYYNTNGGSGTVASQAGRFGNNINLSSATPTRQGYTFTGWNTNADGSGTGFTAGSPFTIPSSNTILFAQWTAITYTLTFDANGGAGAPVIVTGKTAGEVFTLSATVPTRSGYYFTGWNLAAAGTGQGYTVSASFTMPIADATLYAQWALNTYSVSYNANGGNGAPVSQSTDGSGNVTVSNTTPTRPGYTFTGWNTQAGGGGTARLAGTTFAPGGNLVLFAQWTANTITVTYDMNTGTGSAPASATGTFGTTIVLAGSGSMSKANSVFVAWNTLADGTGTAYQADEPNYALPPADITLYAIWAGTNYAIEYQPNGGNNAPGTQYASPGSNVLVAPTAPVLDGYEFGGWQEVSTGNVYSAGAPITMPTANMVMVARWFTRASVHHVTPTPTPTPMPTTPPVVAPKKLTITVYFKGDSAVLTPATKTALTQLAAKAKAYGTASSITVIGRVKETNDKSYDKRLSKQRATNVAVFLKKLGVAGTYAVIAAGISPENKPVSRRVDAVLIWKK